MNRFMFFLLVAIVSLPLMGCDSLQGQMVKEAKKSVAEQLKDPNAAQFSEIFTVKGNHGAINSKSKWQDFAVCGFVNGKNSFGAYAGKTRFVAMLREYESDNRFSLIGVTLEGQSSELKQATVESRNSATPESVFEKIYWNESCIGNGHSKTYSGETW